MKKNNVKGFVLAETIAVSVVIMTSLVIVYTQFVALNNSYKTSFQYNNVNSLYIANNIKQFIKNDNFSKLVNNLSNSQYLDITNCSNDIFKEFLYCELLFDNMDVKTVLFTNEDIKKLKENIDSTSFSQEMKSYIKKINNSIGNNYRIIIEFNNNQFVTLVV